MKNSCEKINELANELHKMEHDTSEGGGYIIMAIPQTNSKKMLDAACGHPMELLNLLTICMANDPKLKKLAKLAIEATEMLVANGKEEKEE